jgi:hypothetical protein
MGATEVTGPTNGVEDCINGAAWQPADHLTEILMPVVDRMAAEPSHQLLLGGHGRAVALDPG